MDDQALQKLADHLAQKAPQAQQAPQGQPGGQPQAQHAPFSPASIFAILQLAAQEMPEIKAIFDKFVAGLGGGQQTA